MTREVLSDGMIKLNSKIGIKDRRTNKIHYEVVCLEENEKFFEEVVIETPKKKSRSKKS